jgi:hypothetical protein
MRKPPRDVDLAAFLLRKANSHPPAEGRRPQADIHSHVVDLPLYDLDQLGLGTTDLIMEPSHGAVHGMGKVYLNHGRGHALQSVALLMEYLCEEAAAVLIYIQLDDANVREARGQYLHE